jgi:hypothetical protein
MRWIIMSAGVVLAATSLAGAFAEPKKPPAKDSPPAKRKVADTKQKDVEKKQAEEKSEKKKSVAEQIEAVQTELNEQSQKLIKEYQASEDDKEKAEIIKQYQKLHTDVADKYLAIVKNNPPDDKDLFPALMALAFSGQHTQVAVDLLEKHHIDNPQMGLICFQLGRQGSPGFEKLFRTVAEKSKSDDAKGAAWLALGQSLLAQSNEDGLDAEKRDSLRHQAESALNTVVDKYADATIFNRKIGDLASGTLFEVQHLAIGMEVPDLEGDDLEGTVFKLSDYRGKVVFLDFWAHW